MREATQIVSDHPKETAETWIKDTNSKLPVDTVAGIVKGKDVTWTMVPQSTMKFANFMHAIGSIKNKPTDWKELFFADIGSLPGS